MVLSLLTGLIPSTGGHIGPRFMRVIDVTESTADATANVTILMDSQKEVATSQQVIRPPHPHPGTQRLRGGDHVTLSTYYDAAPHPLGSSVHESVRCWSEFGCYC